MWPFAEVPDYYGVLGVAEDATDDEIKAAWRRVAQETHPDKGKHPDGAAFKLAAEAYRTLRDPELRERYDAIRPVPLPSSADVPKVVERFRAMWGEPLPSFEEWREKRRRKGR